MSELIRKYAIGSFSDLATPTEDQSDVYKLGDVVEIVDSSNKVTTQYMYVKSHDTLIVKNAYVIQYSGTAGEEVLTADIAPLAVYQLIGVPQVAFTSGYYGWVAIKGDADTVLSESASISDYVLVANAESELQSESTISTASIGVVKETIAASGVCDTYLMGNRVIIA